MVVSIFVLSDISYAIGIFTKNFKNLISQNPMDVLPRMTEGLDLKSPGFFTNSLKIVGLFADI